MPIIQEIDETLRTMVATERRIGLADVLEAIRRIHPSATSIQVAEAVSRLHRRGLIKIEEALVTLRGSAIRTAVLTLA